MAYFYMMATGDFAQWMWKLPFVRGNALRIGMLIFPYAAAFYVTAVALNVLVAAKFSTPLDIGLSVPMVMWAVPSYVDVKAGPKPCARAYGSA